MAEMAAFCENQHVPEILFLVAEQIQSEGKEPEEKQMALFPRRNKAIGRKRRSSRLVSDATPHFGGIDGLIRIQGLRLLQ
jgi:hypothetical protein